MIRSASSPPAVSAVDVEHDGREDDVADGEDGQADEDAARSGRGGVGAGLEAGAVRAAVAEAEAAFVAAPSDSARHAAEGVGRAEEGARGEEGLESRRRRASLGISPRLAVNLRWRIHKHIGILYRVVQHYE